MQNKNPSYHDKQLKRTRQIAKSKSRKATEEAKKSEDKQEKLL